MTSARQAAANRRNAKHSTGPSTQQGKKAVRMNALKNGMTAKVAVLPHESEADYDEMRASLIEAYDPANAAELMLVDLIAIGYWRTIRARRIENAMIDNQIRTRKRVHDIDTKPNPEHDDEACAVILQIESPASMRNFFRYDNSISRDYYRAVQALERAQAARRRQETQTEKSRQAAAATPLHSNGFVPQPSSEPRPPGSVMSSAVSPRTADRTIRAAPAGRTVT